MSQQPRKMLQVCMPPPLTEAVKLAADCELTTISGFVRQVLIDRLRADGIDPATATVLGASRIRNTAAQSSAV
jgi:hypothetical protein